MHLLQVPLVIIVILVIQLMAAVAFTVILSNGPNHNRMARKRMEETSTSIVCENILGDNIIARVWGLL